jgi:hypothetical protein
MRRLSMDEARAAIADHMQYSYADCELADYPGGFVLLIGCVSHCGGTDKSWLGVVTPDDADALERDGLANGWRRSRRMAAETR